MPVREPLRPGGGFVLRRRRDRHRLSAVTISVLLVMLGDERRPQVGAGRYDAARQAAAARIRGLTCATMPARAGGVSDDFDRAALNIGNSTNSRCN